GGVPLASSTTPQPTAAVYNFDSSAQGWTSSGAAITSVTRTTERAFAGTGSLKVSFGTAAGDGFAKVQNPTTPAGALLSFRVWLPAGGKISAVQPYALQGAGGGWAWSGSWRASNTLQAGSWNTITVQVPANAAALAELGVVFTTSGGSVPAAYVDSVTY
ncbi:MAG TPA: hypothetical protein VM686_32475, partial [Polyangiaceae bacterium]|nr:hypothetical protein [Polyangiaceae bacterium]